MGFRVRPQGPSKPLFVIEMEKQPSVQDCFAENVSKDSVPRGCSLCESGRANFRKQCFRGDTKACRGPSFVPLALAQRALQQHGFHVTSRALRHILERTLPTEFFR